MWGYVRCSRGVPQECPGGSFPLRSTAKFNKDRIPSLSRTRGYSSLLLKWGSSSTSRKCKYLGTQVSWEDPTKTAINHRLQLAKAAYSKLAQSWRSRVPISVKLSVFESNTVPVATYSLATLTLEDKHLKQISFPKFNVLPV